MNKILVVSAFILQTFLAGYAAEANAAENAQLPNPQSVQAAQKVDDFWFMPARMSSAERAVGTIKNLQQDIVGYSGWHIDDLEVDRFGMRAKGKDAIFIIPFEEVSRMIVHHYLAQKDFAWGLTVTFNTERQPVFLRSTSEKTARRLGDAVGTLAMELGVRMLGGAGMRLRNSTPADRANVELDGEYGVSVHSVFTGSPAERAGFKSNDLIVEVGGAQVVKMTDVIEKIVKAETEAKTLKIKLLRSEGDMINEFQLKLKFGAPNTASPDQ